MTLVIDASVALSALTTGGPVGRWAEEQLVSSRDLVTPHHFHLEVTNVLRRAQLAGQLDATAASLAFQDLRRLPVRVIPFDPLAERIWTLRDNLTSYDAAYVAAAEALDAPLATLDKKLVQSPGPTCTFRYP